MVKNGLSIFACSETQKFGHVTFFWNGNRSGYFNENLETYVEIPSDNVPFNQAPLMKAREITAAGKEALRSGKASSPTSGPPGLTMPGPMQPAGGKMREARVR